MYKLAVETLVACFFLMFVVTILMQVPGYPLLPIQVLAFATLMGLTLSFPAVFVMATFGAFWEILTGRHPEW